MSTNAKILGERKSEQDLSSVKKAVIDVERKFQHYFLFTVSETCSGIFIRYFQGARGPDHCM